MQLPFTDYITNILGFQSAAQFGAKLSEPNSETGYGIPASLDDINCDVYTQTLPSTLSTAAASVVYVRHNLAVLPEHWTGSGVGSSWLNIQSSHTDLVGCFYNIKHADFVAFDKSFFEFLGSSPKSEIAHTFPSEEQTSVHEAPVYVAETNELVFADTKVVGWLYALDVSTFQIRKLTTTPPLHNVNGGTLNRHNKHIYLTTNGSPTPGIWSCSLPTTTHKQATATTNEDQKPEQLTCTPVVNNYRTTHLNAPNDLIFTSQNHLLFTDPNYGWDQAWPGVGPPELPTAVYHFNTTSRALITLTNDDVLAPNGLALSRDEKTLYVADSNSTSGRPIRVWDAAVRNVYAFEVDVSVPRLSNRRLVHVVEAGWPDGLRVTRGGLLLVASMGGVDVVDVERGGVLLGKINVGDDVVFNLEPVGEGKRTWMLTGKKGVYKVSVAG